MSMPVMVTNTPVRLLFGKMNGKFGIILNSVNQIESERTHDEQKNGLHLELRVYGCLSRMLILTMLAILQAMMNMNFALSFHVSVFFMVITCYATDTAALFPSPFIRHAHLLSSHSAFWHLVDCGFFCGVQLISVLEESAHAHINTWKKMVIQWNE